MENTNGDFQDSSLYLPGPSTNPISEISNISGNLLDTHYGNLGFMIRMGIFQNRARILSNPKIIVIDGQEAYFTTGDSVPYTSINENTNNLITQFYDTGVKLTVKPIIRKDEFVELSVIPEFSIITDYVPGKEEGTSDDTTPDYELPVIAERTAKTNLLVKSGSKFILGGLLSEKNIDTTWKVPIMGSIPVLGLLFSSKYVEKRISELVISIQPIILDPKEPFVFPQKFTEQIKFEREQENVKETPPTPTPFVPFRESEATATPKSDTTEEQVMIEEPDIRAEEILKEVQEPALRNLYEESSPSEINLEGETEEPEIPPIENVHVNTPTPTPRHKHTISFIGTIIVL